MQLSMITIVIGVLASSVIAGPIAQPQSGGISFGKSNRPAAATEGLPCTGVIEGAEATGVCTPFGDCGLSGGNSNEFVRIKSADC
ncbi:hypothetical protein DL95DRAFT_386257 [Leptodontidium sp. 2 PMI_412]|nr:hypothetical protein DL95DRAFT_386257 [Leptodontidium sp. 2 PMI_412]